MALQHPTLQPTATSVTGLASAKLNPGHPALSDLNDPEALDLKLSVEPGRE